MLPIHFAPLQGYTEDVYRRAHHRLCGGVARYYTPFMRVEHGEVRRKDAFDMLPQYNEGVPLALQVIATGADEMRVLLGAIEERWNDVGMVEGERLHIDVNMGCPFPLQVRHGRGAGVLQLPEKVEEICRFMADHPQYAWSVKMRLGVEEPDEWRSILPLLDAAPLEHITVHPRVARQQYGGEPNMEAFEALMAASHTPIIYNGDVTTVEEICELEARYGAPNDAAHAPLAGVMIGRGLLARPTLAREYAEGATCTDAEVVEALCSLHDAVHESYAARIPGEAQLLQKLRTFWDYTETTLGRKPWKKVHKAGNMKNYLAAVAQVGG